MWPFRRKPWHPTTPPITRSTLNVFLSGHRVVVIHVWADWNLIDRDMDKIVSSVQEDYRGRAEFLSLDLDSEGADELAQQWQVMNLPSLVYFVNGQHLETVVGCRPSEDIRERLTKIV